MKQIIFTNYETFEDDKVKAILTMDYGYKEEDITQSLIDDMRYGIVDDDWNITYEELCNFFEDKKLILFGRIGRWDGDVTGWETHKGFEKLFSEATKDCDYWEIYDDNGHMYIRCSHHDGTCSYEVKELTDEGNNYIENWEYNWNDKRDSKYIGKQVVKRYSKLPRYWR